MDDIYRFKRHQVLPKLGGIRDQTFTFVTMLDIITKEEDLKNAPDPNYPGEYKLKIMKIRSGNFMLP